MQHLTNIIFETGALGLYVFESNLSATTEKFKTIINTEKS